MPEPHVQGGHSQVEWGVDDRGLVRPPQMHAGHHLGSKIEALFGMTPTQQERFRRDLGRQQEDHVSRRLSRRLRDEPDGT